MKAANWLTYVLRKEEFQEMITRSTKETRAEIIIIPVATNNLEALSRNKLEAMSGKEVRKIKIKVATSNKTAG